MKEPWEVWVKPSGGGGGRRGNHLLSDGMTVLRFEDDILHVHGISYGRIAKGDEIRVIHGVVTINGTIRQPHHVMNQAPAEAGADPPATAPKPKHPEFAEKLRGLASSLLRQSGTTLEVEFPVFHGNFIAPKSEKDALTVLEFWGFGTEMARTVVADARLDGMKGFKEWMEAASKKK